MKRFLFLVLCLPIVAGAMPVKTKVISRRAYFYETADQLHEALDLKSKSLKFTKSDFDLCGTSLVRKGKTLTYSCTLPIPSKARISKLQRQLSPTAVDVVFGATKREVHIVLHENAKSLTLTTAFDATGIDFDLTRFNDDILDVLAKNAQLIIADALQKQPVRYEVLESRF